MLVEQLERRRLFAITVSEGYPGFYEVTGDEFANTIDISVSQGDMTFTLNGTTYSNVERVNVYGLGGDDSISVLSVDGSGGIGSSIDGGDGNDVLSLNFDGAIWGRGGNDTIHISDSFMGEVYGDAGDDTLTISGECVQAVIRGGDGNDFIDASDNNYAVYIHGDAGDDTIYGSAHDDSLYGDGGTDTVFAMGGNDTIFSTEYAHGGDGNDVLYKEAGTTPSYDGIEQVLNA